MINYILECHFVLFTFRLYCPQNLTLWKSFKFNDSTTYAPNLLDECHLFTSKLLCGDNKLMVIVEYQINTFALK